MQDEGGIEFQSRRVRELLNPFPSRSAVDQHFGPADERNLAVSQMVEMFECQPTARLVVYHHRADRVSRHLPADGRRPDISLAEVRKQLNVHEKPVRHND